MIGSFMLWPMDIAVENKKSGLANFILNIDHSLHPPLNQKLSLAFSTLQFLLKTPTWGGSHHTFYLTQPLTAGLAKSFERLV